VCATTNAEAVTGAMNCIGCTRDSARSSTGLIDWRDRWLPSNHGEDVLLGFFRDILGNDVRRGVN
jgi:hypothetical protein